MLYVLKQIAITGIKSEAPPSVADEMIVVKRLQKQVLRTLIAAQRRLGAGVVLVGHDMGLMAQFVDRLGVMYAGMRSRRVSPRLGPSNGGEELT